MGEVSSYLLYAAPNAKFIKNDKKENVVKKSKPIYKKWWFWVAVLVLFSMFSAASSGGKNKTVTEKEYMSNRAGEKIVIS